jgi:hypothetical protein
MSGSPLHANAPFARQQDLRGRFSAGGLWDRKGVLVP